MLREEYFRRLVDEAYIDLFLAGVDGARIYWPWRMCRENGSLQKRYRNSCEVFWLDSSIFNEQYGNEDVLDDGHQIGADAVLLADKIGDYDLTVKQIKEGLDIADDHAFSGDIVIPLQEPYDECYTEFAGESEYYAIGGLNTAGTDQPRIAAAKQVREIAGEDIHLHGLGWGVRDELLEEIHRNPNLIDSVDYSSPVQGTMENLPGKERMSVVASEAATELVRDLRKVTPYVDLDPEPSAMRDDGQVGFDELV